MTESGEQLLLNQQPVLLDWNSSQKENLPFYTGIVPRDNYKEIRFNLTLGEDAIKYTAKDSSAPLTLIDSLNRIIPSEVNTFSVSLTLQEPLSLNSSQSQVNLLFDISQSFQALYEDESLVVLFKPMFRIASTGKQQSGLLGVISRVNDEQITITPKNRPTEIKLPWHSIKTITLDGVTINQKELISKAQNKKILVWLVQLSQSAELHAFTGEAPLQIVNGNLLKIEGGVKIQGNILSPKGKNEETIIFPNVTIYDTKGKPINITIDALLSGQGLSGTLHEREGQLRLLKGELIAQVLSTEPLSVSPIRYNNYLQYLAHPLVAIGHAEIHSLLPDQLVKLSGVAVGNTFQTDKIQPLDTEQVSFSMTLPSTLSQSPIEAILHNTTIAIENLSHQQSLVRLFIDETPVQLPATPDYIDVQQSQVRIYSDRVLDGNKTIAFKSFDAAKPALKKLLEDAQHINEIHAKGILSQNILIANSLDIVFYSASIFDALKTTDLEEELYTSSDNIVSNKQKNSDHKTLLIGGISAALGLPLLAGGAYWIFKQGHKSKEPNTKQSQPDDNAFTIIPSSLNLNDEKNGKIIINQTSNPSEKDQNSASSFDKFTQQEPLYFNINFTEKNNEEDEKVNQKEDSTYKPSENRKEENEQKPEITEKKNEAKRFKKRPIEITPYGIRNNKNIVKFKENYYEERIDDNGKYYYLTTTMVEVEHTIYFFSDEESPLTSLNEPTKKNHQPKKTTIKQPSDLATFSKRPPYFIEYDHNNNNNNEIIVMENGNYYKEFNKNEGKFYYQKLELIFDGDNLFFFPNENSYITRSDASKLGINNRNEQVKISFKSKPIAQTTTKAPPTGDTNTEEDKYYFTAKTRPADAKLYKDLEYTKIYKIKNKLYMEGGDAEGNIVYSEVEEKKSVDTSGKITLNYEIKTAPVQLIDFSQGEQLDQWYRSNFPDLFTSPHNDENIFFENEDITDLLKKNMMIDLRLAVNFIAAYSQKNHDILFYKHESNHQANEPIDRLKNSFIDPTILTHTKKPEDVPEQLKTSIKTSNINFIEDFYKSTKRYAILPGLPGAHFNAIVLVKSEGGKGIIPIIIEPGSGYSEEYKLSTMNRLIQMLPDNNELQVKLDLKDNVRRINADIQKNEGTSCGPISLVAATRLIEAIEAGKISPDNLSTDFVKLMIDDIKNHQDFKWEPGFPRLRNYILHNLDKDNRLKKQSPYKR